MYFHRATQIRNWIISKADDKVLGFFERKVLSAIFGLVCVDGIWSRRFNHELYILYSNKSSFIGV